MGSRPVIVQDVVVDEHVGPAGIAETVYPRIGAFVLVEGFHVTVAELEATPVDFTD